MTGSEVGLLYVPEAPEVVLLRRESLVFAGPGVSPAVSQPHVIAAVG